MTSRNDLNFTRPKGKIPWPFAKGKYACYKSFDGVDIHDRNAISKRLLQEDDCTKKRVLQMFLDITREDNIFPDDYFSPEQLKNVFAQLLK